MIERAGRRIAPLWATGIATSFAPGIALAQRLGGAVGDDVPLWRVVGALAFCLALAVAAAVVLRLRIRGSARLVGTAPRQLKLVESLRLSHQVDVCLVCYGERQVLLATSPQGVIVLAPVSTTEVDAA